MADPAATPPARQRTPVLLVVEDEAPNRALLRAVLGRATDRRLRQADVIEAPNLATARLVVASRQVGIVLLDVRLPDGSGLDLARELRARPPEERPRVLVLSASVLPAERDTALAAGADGFLGKPYRPADLVDAVLELVDLAETDRPETDRLAETDRPETDRPADAARRADSGSTATAAVRRGGRPPGP